MNGTLSNGICLLKYVTVVKEVVPILSDMVAHPYNVQLRLVEVVLPHDVPTPHVIFDT